MIATSVRSADASGRWVGNTPRESYRPAALEELIDQIKAGATIKYPPQVLNHEMEHVSQDVERRLKSQGIDNMDLTRRSDAIVAVFPVGHNDQIMLVTDGGMVIRCPVHDIRIARRRSQGVVIFKVGDGERVVSVARLPEESPGEPDENGGADEPDDQQASEGDA